MRSLVVIIGSIIVALGVFGLARPEDVSAVVLGWPADVRFYVAAGSRVALGTVLVVAAPRCRFPRVMNAVGLVAFVSAATVVVLGPSRVESFVQWWFLQPRPIVRSSDVAAVLFGAFLVYSGSGRPSG